jgi:hypothetical protein
MWLALTGRALLALGRMLQTAQPWLQQQLQTGSAPGRTFSALYEPIAASVLGMGQLGVLQQHHTTAAASVPAKLLQDLAELTDALAPRLAALDSLLRVALDPLQRGPAAEAAVVQAVFQGCAEGWLPEGLQQLGAKVWAAWPQKYACNDDLCLNLDCLTEHSCGKSQRTGCKVRGQCMTWLNALAPVCPGECQPASLFRQSAIGR